MKLARWISEVWDDIMVYFLTLVGVLVAQFLPSLKSNANFDIVVTGSRVLIASVVALYLVLQDEDTKGDPVARKGKKGALKRRFSSALTSGFTWSTLTGMV